MGEAVVAFMVSATVQGRWADADSRVRGYELTI